MKKIKRDDATEAGSFADFFLRMRGANSRANRVSVLLAVGKSPEPSCKMVPHCYERTSLRKKGGGGKKYLEGLRIHDKEDSRRNVGGSIQEFVVRKQQMTTLVGRAEVRIHGVNISR